MSLLEFDRFFASTETKTLCQPTLWSVVPDEASSLVGMKALSPCPGWKSTPRKISLEVRAGKELQSLEMPNGLSQWPRLLVHPAMLSRLWVYAFST
jgi:hypothetical protein